MQRYNTEEIRAAARNLNNIADQLQTLKSGSMTKISSDAKPLQGDMATALQEELEKRGNELLNLKKGVDQVATTLFDFAKRLDIADEQAKAMIQSR